MDFFFLWRQKSSCWMWDIYYLKHVLHNININKYIYMYIYIYNNKSKNILTLLGYYCFFSSSAILSWHFIQLIRKLIKVMKRIRNIWFIVSMFTFIAAVVISEYFEDPQTSLLCWLSSSCFKSENNCLSHKTMYQDTWVLCLQANYSLIFSVMHSLIPTYLKQSCKSLAPLKHVLKCFGNIFSTDALENCFSVRNTFWNVW